MISIKYLTSIYDILSYIYIYILYIYIIKIIVLLYDIGNNINYYDNNTNDNILYNIYIYIELN